MSNKVLLLILDGWGVSSSIKGDAIQAADTPYYDSLVASCPHTLLQASGVYVGLPDGIMGNSEVGHENIGAGRISKQKLTQISDLVRSGEFFNNPALSKAVEHAQKNNSKLHLMGLISEGDVHAHLGHLDGLIELARRKGLAPEKLFLHAISDGRDDPPRVAAHLMERYQPRINIATVSGRYWAMDRDNNWDRLESYIDCVIYGKGERANSAVEAITKGYEYADTGRNKTGASDEFILPTIVNDKGLIQDGDSVIFFNFRPDRAREISKRLGLDTMNKPLGVSPSKDFKNLSEKNKENWTNLYYLCFTDYSGELGLPVAFSSGSLPKQDRSMSLGELVSSLGLRQFRTAETEKFNHVTSFFNQGAKDAFPGEDRELVASPKVSTYDLQPEMSIEGVTNGLVKALESREYDLLVCNFANPDMVGHTGIWDAVLKALKAVDNSVERVVETAKKNGYLVLLTADHGNADQMFDTNGGVRTAHSCNPVPLILIGADGVKLRDYKADPNDLVASTTLSNIAPTIVELMGLEKPKQMLSTSLLVH